MLQALARWLAKADRFMRRVPDEYRPDIVSAILRAYGPIEPAGSARITRPGSIRINRGSTMVDQRGSTRLDQGVDQAPDQPPDQRVDQHADQPGLINADQRGLGGPLGGQSSYTPGFLSFWKAYPKRVGKGKAFESWKKQKLEDQAQEICENLARQMPFLMREQGKFCPNPATWLNQKRWEDEPPQPSKLKTDVSGLVRFAERQQP